MAGVFYLVSNYLFEIDTTPSATPGSETWSRLAGGISSVEQSNNEEVDQTKYIDHEGFGSSDVIAAQKTLSFSGHRKVGDAAQDYIMSLELEIGEARKTKFRLTQPGTGKMLSGPITIVEINPGGGDAGSKPEIGFGIHFNGKPVVTP